MTGAFAEFSSMQVCDEICMGFVGWLSCHYVMVKRLKLMSNGTGNGDRVLFISLGCLCVTLLVNLALMISLGFTTQMPRLLPVVAIDSPDAYDPDLSLEADRESFRQVLEPVISGASTTEEKVHAILSWVMDQVSRTGPGQANVSSWKMIEEGRLGHGLLCSSMAQIFHDALIVQGVPARRILMRRDVFDINSTHTSVEAYIDGKWRLYDPTFHIALKANGERIGAFDARRLRLLQNGKPSGLEIEFLGEVRYPARIDTYPVRYEAHLDNVYVELARSHGLKRIIPFLGIWIGPQWAYEQDSSVLGTVSEEFYSVLYYAVMAVLPSLNLIFIIAISMTRRMSCMRA